MLFYFVFLCVYVFCSDLWFSVCCVYFVGFGLVCFVLVWIGLLFCSLRLGLVCSLDCSLSGLLNVLGYFSCCLWVYWLFDLVYCLVCGFGCEFAGGFVDLCSLCFGLLFGLDTLIVGCGYLVCLADICVWWVVGGNFGWISC